MADPHAPDLAAIPPIRNENDMLCRCEGDWFCRAFELGAVIDAQAARLAVVEAERDELRSRRNDALAAAEHEAKHLHLEHQRAEDAQARLAAVEQVVDASVQFALEFPFSGADRWFERRDTFLAAVAALKGAPDG